MVFRPRSRHAAWWKTAALRAADRREKMMETTNDQFDAEFEQTEKGLHIPRRMFLRLGAAGVGAVAWQWRPMGWRRICAAGA